MGAVMPGAETFTRTEWHMYDSSTGMPVGKIIPKTGGAVEVYDTSHRYVGESTTTGDRDADLSHWRHMIAAFTKSFREQAYRRYHEDYYGEEG